MPEPEAPLPAILGVQWRCTGEAAELTAWADAATRGGMLWLDDGERRERHPVPSVAAEPDGSGDVLELRLDVIEDPAWVDVGRTTAFLCTEAPLRQLYLISFDYEVADCVRDPGFPEIEGVDPCAGLWP